jgi:hypothetical protein
MFKKRSFLNLSVPHRTAIINVATGTAFQINSNQYNIITSIGGGVQ